MKRLLTGLFFILLLLAGAIAFFRIAPQFAPEPVKPALGWVKQTQDHYTGQFIAWRNRLLGITNLVKDSRQSPTAVLSDSATQTELSRVDISRVEVAQVDLDQNGESPSRFEVGQSLTADSAPPVAQSAASKAVGESPAPVAEPASPAAVAGDSPPDDPMKTGSDTRLPVESNRALAVLTDADDVLAKADAAIAAADAALARAQQRGGEPAKTVTADNADSENRGDATNTHSGGFSRPSDAPTKTDEQAPGSVTGGAAIVLSQSLTPAPALSGSSDPIRVARAEARIPVPKVIPPDAPTPPEPVTERGRSQQASIQNFLAGQVVEFETGRDVLTRQGRRALNELLDMIQANQDTVITIQGHTDNVGDEASNLELSSARSIRARAYLIARGVDPDRLRVQGFGELRPVASNRTVEGRIRNRRIDFAVSDR